MRAGASGMRVDWMRMSRRAVNAAALAGAVAMLPVALRAMEPVMLRLMEILVGIGKACVTLLRASGY